MATLSFLSDTIVIFRFGFIPIVNPYWITFFQYKITDTKKYTLPYNLMLNKPCQSSIKHKTRTVVESNLGREATILFPFELVYLYTMYLSLF